MNSINHVELVHRLRKLSPRAGTYAIQQFYQTLSQGQAILVYYGDYIVLNNPDGSMGLISASTLVTVGDTNGRATHQHR